MSDKITQQDFFKSLERLEALATGSETEESDLQKAQICTGPGNEPQSWPGGDKSEYGPGWDDSIQQDGTDYTGPGSKARKSIAEKVFKGEPLTPSEIMILKSDVDDVSKAKKKDDDDDKKAPPWLAGKDEDEEEEGPMMGKSIVEAIQENDDLQKGIEVSDFLKEFAKAFAIGLHGMEGRLHKSITDQVTENMLYALGTVAENQGEFNKSLAEAVANIGHGFAGFMDYQEQAEQAPAGPPRSQLRAVAGGQQQQVQVLNKSESGTTPLDNLSKAQIADRMTDLVEKGQMAPLDAIKYDTTGDMSPQVQDLVAKAFAAGQ